MTGDEDKTATAESRDEVRSILAESVDENRCRLANPLLTGV
jgi:hypothetical protein